METVAKLSAGLLVGSWVYKILAGDKSGKALQESILKSLEPGTLEKPKTERSSSDYNSIMSRSEEAATPNQATRPMRYRTDSFAEVTGESVTTSKPLYIFVLTGGPCAGKTTAMARVSNYFRQRGFTVYTVPEAATIMMSNGATFADLDTDEKELTFQACLLKTQMNLEDLFVRMSSTTDKPCILLCDRGTMDGRAYIPPDTWDRMMLRAGYDYINLRDRRYNAVFHLVTAANAAEKYYTLENNNVRLETVEEARAVDLRLQEAWIGHSNVVVFDNSTGFEDKMQRLISTTSQLVGLSTGTKKQFVKYLLEGEVKTVPVRFEKFEVEKVYLHLEGLADKEYCFQRKRAQGALCSYQLTTVKKKQGTKIETKRLIRGREYAYNYSSLADSSRKIVHQRRITFLYEGLYYEIYHYINENLTVLNCQVDEYIKEIKLPPFLKVVREITDEPKYSSYYLSLKNRPASPDQ